MKQSFPVKVLIDSGASGNFISSLCLPQIKVPLHQNATYYQISNIQGKSLGKGLVHHHTLEVTLRIGCLHSERISFLVLEEAAVDIVPGRPWLTLHHPDIHWNSGKVLKWSEYCLPPVLHPCAYFSKKMSPAEQNYDIGNCELLAIKLALEE